MNFVTASVFVAMVVVVVSARTNMSVVLLIIDDMRPEIGRYAGVDDSYFPNIITPNMDALSESGVTFTKAYTSVSATQISFFL